MVFKASSLICPAREVEFDTNIDLTATLFLSD